MKKVAALIFIGLMGGAMATWAETSDYNARFATNTRTQPGYFTNMAHDWARGVTNIFSSPLEIPITIKKYHNDDKGAPVLREAVGVTDGVIRMVTRAVSGFWDLVVSFVPGDQEGAPVKPEALF